MNATFDPQSWFLRHVAFLLVSSALSAAAATNFAPSISLLLDEDAALALTAGLKQYDPPPKFAGKVTIVGGGTSSIHINRWTAEFATLFPDIDLDTHGGGSAAGINGLVDGKVDIVHMNRPLETNEVASFKAKFGYAPAQIIVAQGAEGIYVNKNNPISGLTLAQLDAIYSRDAERGGGRLELWGDLGVAGPLASEPIDRVSLNQFHSGYLFFKDFVMQGADYRFDVDFESVPTSVVQAVGANDAAIGFASVALATRRTRFVPVQATDGRYLLPSYENVSSGHYPLTRFVRIVFNRKPDGTMNRAALEFLRFAVSRRGQRISSIAGSYPISAEQQQQALTTIGEAP